MPEELARVAVNKLQFKRGLVSRAAVERTTARKLDKSIHDVAIQWSARTVPDDRLYVFDPDDPRDMIAVMDSRSVITIYCTAVAKVKGKRRRKHADEQRVGEDTQKEEATTERIQGDAHWPGSPFSDSEQWPGAEGNVTGLREVQGPTP